MLSKSEYEVKIDCKNKRCSTCGTDLSTIPCRPLLNSNVKLACLRFDAGNLRKEEQIFNFLNLHAVHLQRTLPSLYDLSKTGSS